MKVWSEIDCYNINGKPVRPGTGNTLLVCSTSPANRIIELHFEDKIISVHAEELKKAIQNATSNEVK